jgi:hypothetical protein
MHFHAYHTYLSQFKVFFTFISANGVLAPVRSLIFNLFTFLDWLIFGKNFTVFSDIDFSFVIWLCGYLWFGFVWLD